jgi:hypothetical protein
MDLCTVAAKPLEYHTRTVRVAAFMGRGAEAIALYDPKCRDGEPLVSVELKSNTKGEIGQLRTILAKKRYAFVTVEGTVHGPEPVEVDPKLPDWVKERFKGSVKHYGHGDAFDMMIEVENVIQAKDVDDGRSGSQRR